MDRGGSPGEGLHVVTMGRIETSPGQAFDWDAHPFWEIEVQEEGTVRLGLAGAHGQLRPGDVVLYPPGVRHAAWNLQRSPAFSLVIHFAGPAESLVEGKPAFTLQPGRALGRLNGAEMLWVQQIYHQLWWEETTRNTRYAEAQDALLRLLIIGLERMLGGGCADLPPLGAVPPDVVRFLGYLRAALDQPEPLQTAAARMGSNYDSLRHRFRAALGVSPKRLLTELRMQQARLLLATTRLSVKEIGGRVGYPEPQRFAAAFAREHGRSPLSWRRSPEAPGNARPGARKAVRLRVESGEPLL